MQRKKLNIIFKLFVLFTALVISSCTDKSMEGNIIFTQVEGTLQQPNFTTGEFWQYYSKAQIAAINPSKESKDIELLTKDFYSACSPKISYDGKRMVFSAQKNENDSWQIWEMDLSNLKTKQLISTEENCINPVYLPNGNIVFSKLISNSNKTNGYTLFTCNPKGSEIKQITFNPHSYFNSTILQDGRLLTISKQYFPESQQSVLLVFRPDGTKQELFFKGNPNSNLISGGYETNNSEVVFISSENNKKSNIISVNYNQPMHGKTNLTSNLKGDFLSVYPKNNNNCIVSYSASKNDNYGLYEFNIDKNSLGKPIYKNDKYNVTDAVYVKNKKVPRKLPSEVNLDVNTALLVCQDANYTENLNDSISKATKIEIVGLENSLGTVNLEKDGSFYLKVLADTPFRIQTLNENNEIVNGPGSWIFMRPNERRGCVGCHENKDQVPENRQPLSVQKAPFILASQVEKINSKKEQ